MGSSCSSEAAITSPQLNSRDVDSKRFGHPDTSSFDVMASPSPSDQPINAKETKRRWSQQLISKLQLVPSTSNPTSPIQPPKSILTIRRKSSIETTIGDEKSTSKKIVDTDQCIDKIVEMTQKLTSADYATMTVVVENAEVLKHLHRRPGVHINLQTDRLIRIDPSLPRDVMLQPERWIQLNGTDISQRYGQIPPHLASVGYYAGTCISVRDPTSRRAGDVGVLSVVYDQDKTNDFGDGHVTIVKNFSRMIGRHLEHRLQQLVAKEQDDMNKHVNIQMDITCTTSTSSSTPTTTANNSMITSASSIKDTRKEIWYSSNDASKDELVHLPWIKNWNESYPQPPILPNDAERCRVVEDFFVVDSVEEEMFTQMCQVAREQFETCFASITILNSDIQFFKGTDISLTCPPGVRNAAQARHTDRAPALCNYTLKKGSTFVIPDLSVDSTFNTNPFHTDAQVNFYAGALLTTAAGIHIGVMCLLDDRARPDFGDEEISILEQIAIITMQQLEARRQKIKASLTHRSLNQQLLFEQSQSAIAPKKVASLVTMNINSWNIIRQSLSENIIHDILALYVKTLQPLMSTYHAYQILQQDQYLQLAFFSAVDAVSYCLSAQLALLQAPWPKVLLEHPLAAVQRSPSGTLLFAGLRVGMSIHVGSVSATVISSTQRTTYIGSTMRITQKFGKIVNDGQIIITDAVWECIRDGTHPIIPHQVLDLGIVRILDEKETMTLYQITPTALAVGWIQATPRSPASSTPTGRVFPSLPLQAVTASYYDAPIPSPPSHLIHIVHLSISHFHETIARNPEIARLTLDRYEMCVMTTLNQFRGYVSNQEMDTFIITFHTPMDAIKWSLHLQLALMEVEWPSELLEQPRSCVVTNADQSLATKITHPSISITTIPELPPLEPDAFTYLGIRTCCCIASLPCISYGPNSLGRMSYTSDVIHTINKWGKAAHGGQILIHDSVMNSCRNMIEQMQHEGTCISYDLGFYHVKGTDTGMQLFDIIPSSLRGRIFPRPIHLAYLGPRRRVSSIHHSGPIIHELPASPTHTSASEIVPPA